MLFRLLLISTVLSLSLFANNTIVNPCTDQNINKLCINDEVQNLSYVDTEITYRYNIDNENNPFLHKRVIKELDGTESVTIVDATSSDKYFTKIYTFDTNGQVLNEKVSGTDIDTRTTKYEHGTIDGNYAVKTINPLNQIVVNIYDSNKNIIKHIDSNNLETSYEYDTNNRVVKKTPPSGIATTYEYTTDDLIAGATYKVTQTTQNEPTVVQFYDSDDNLIATHKEGFDGRYIVTENSGEYFPYFKSEEKFTIPSNTQDEQSDNLEYEYNVLGYKTKITDTQGSKVTSLQYDLLNRVVQEEIIRDGNENNKETIYYIYDRANYGQGKISYIKSNEYKKEFFYNELSKLKVTKEYIGNKIFTNQFTYTPNGKLEKTITPNGFEIINDYNKYGYLSGVKTPKTTMSELNIENSKELLIDNLNDRLSIYKKYLELKTKATVYSLKKDIYQQLSSDYTDADIKQKLSDVVVLLDETIQLLNQTITEFEMALASYDNKIENYIVPALTQKNDEKTFQSLYTIFEEQRNEYIALATTHLDIANSLLEEAITTPNILNDQFSHHKELITYYKDIAQNSIDIGSNYAQLSNNFSLKYFDIKKGDAQTTSSIYTGLLEDPDYKYFYKVLEQNALGKVIKSIHGNGVVTSNEYDLATGNITRVTIGYYGQSDIKDLKYEYNTNGNLIASYDVKKFFTQRYIYDDDKRLVRATNVGEDYYTNISYDFDKPSVYQYNQSENRFENTQNNVKVTTNKTYAVQDNNLTISSSYSPNKLSYEKTVLSSQGDNSSRYFKVDKTFKFDVKNDQLIYKNFIFANDTLVAINIQSEIDDILTPANYYIHNDINGSLDIITNELSLVKEKIYYRPYGELSNKSWINTVNPNSITTIGFKGFEHDTNLGLIDMGSYAYDPQYGKLLTKDSVQNPFNITEMDQNIQSLTAYTNTIISAEEPIDTTKVWYKPNIEDGGMDIYIYQDGVWKLIGSVGKLNQEGEVATDTVDQLTNLSCFEGDKGFVASGSNSVAYICNNSNTWELGGAFRGTFDIIDLATTYFNALDGSTVTAVASNGEFSGSKIFTKNGNFWVDSTSDFYIFDSLNSVLANSSFAVGDRVFFPKDSSTYYTFRRYNLVSSGVKWVYNPILENVDFNNSEIVNAELKADISTMYTDLPAVALVQSELYIKELDTQNRNIYKRADGVYIAKTGAVIPSSYLDSSSVMSLPLAYDATTVTFDTEQRINLDNRTQATNWADAPNDVEIAIPSISKTYTHIINGALDFWTDNITTDGQASATEIFTKGSRSNLPTVTHSITALTKEVGTEPNYTTTGVTSTIDGSFKQWYYSLTGTITNNLLDAAKIDNIYNLYNDLLPNSIEIAIYNGNLVKKNTTTAVWYDVVTNNVIKSENTYFSDYALSTYTRDTQNAYHKIPSRFTGAITKNTNYNSSSYLYKKDGKYYVIDPSNPDGSFLATGYFLLLNYPQVRFYDVASSVKVAVSGNDGNLGCYNNSTTSAVMSGGWCDGAGHMDRVGNDFISYLVNNLMTNWIGGGFYQ